MPALDLKELVQAADAAHRTTQPDGRASVGLPANDLHEQMRPRTQLNFSNVPVAIKEMFQARAESLGFKWPVHYLYHLMREDGLDVPDPDLFDGRGRPAPARNRDNLL